MIFVHRYDAKQVMRGVKRTNILYGALHLQATRVVFIHGSVDPWHALGITRTVKQDSPAIYIRGALLLFTSAHHLIVHNMAYNAFSPSVKEGFVRSREYSNYLVQYEDYFQGRLKLLFGELNIL
jgi:hypothetical protein